MRSSKIYLAYFLSRDFEPKWTVRTKAFCFHFYCISATVFWMPKLWCHPEIAESSPEISQHSLRFPQRDSSIGTVVFPHFLSQHFWKTGPVGFFHLDLAQRCFQLEIFPENGMVFGSHPSMGCKMFTGLQSKCELNKEHAFFLPDLCPWTRIYWMPYQHRFDQSRSLSCFLSKVLCNFLQWPQSFYFPMHCRDNHQMTNHSHTSCWHNHLSAFWCPRLRLGPPVMYPLHISSLTFRWNSKTVLPCGDSIWQATS